MSQSRFFLLLSLLTLFVFAGMAFLHQLPALKTYWDVTIGSAVFFIVLSVAMYYLGFRMAMSENKKAFISLIIGFVFGKIMLSIFWIAVYFKIMEPASRFFLLPFFIVYLVYTIFETYVLTKLGRIEAK